MMCGGTSEEKPATQEVQTLVTGVKSDAEAKASRTFSAFTAVKFKTQVVAGTNYFVKVDVGNDQFAHVRIFCPLPHTGSDPELHSIQVDKTKDDPIEFF